MIGLSRRCSVQNDSTRPRTDPGHPRVARRRDHRLRTDRHLSRAAAQRHPALPRRLAQRPRLADSGEPAGRRRGPPRSPPAARRSPHSRPRSPEARDRPPRPADHRRPAAHHGLRPARRDRRARPAPPRRARRPTALSRPADDLAPDQPRPVGARAAATPAPAARPPRRPTSPPPPPTLPCRCPPPAAPGPFGRTGDADPTRADDTPADESVPEPSDTPASPVDGDVPAGPPVDSAPTPPATEPDAGPRRPPIPPRRPMRRRTTRRRPRQTPSDTTPQDNPTPPTDATPQPADGARPSRPRRAHAGARSRTRHRRRTPRTAARSVSGASGRRRAAAGRPPRRPDSGRRKRDAPAPARRVVAWSQRPESGARLRRSPPAGPETDRAAVRRRPAVPGPGIGRARAGGCWPGWLRCGVGRGRRIVLRRRVGRRVSTGGAGLSCGASVGGVGSAGDVGAGVSSPAAWAPSRRAGRRARRRRPDWRRVARLGHRLVRRALWRVGSGITGAAERAGRLAADTCTGVSATGPATSGVVQEVAGRAGTAGVAARRRRGRVGRDRGHRLADEATVGRLARHGVGAPDGERAGASDGQRARRAAGECDRRASGDRGRRRPAARRAAVRPAPTHRSARALGAGPGIAERQDVAAQQGEDRCDQCASGDRAGEPRDGGPGVRGRVNHSGRNIDPNAQVPGMFRAPKSRGSCVDHVFRAVGCWNLARGRLY